GDHGFEWDAVLEHHLHERVVDRRQRGRQRLLDRQVEDRLLSGCELDRALAEPADRLRHREHTLAGSSGEVAMYADGGDETDSFLVAPAYLGAEHPGCDHADVAGRVEAVEGERVSAGDDREPVGGTA